MHLLPQDFDDASYWQNIYEQPLPFWQQALQTIAELHDLPAGEWQRASLGRNIVFYTPSVVVKLGPPSWQGEMAREAVALNFVAGRLPVATPVCIASGTVDGWDYLVQEWMPGRNLRELWQELDDKAKATLAHQQGEIMAAIHSLPIQDVRAILGFDWDRMLTEQREVCVRDMQASGVDAALVEQIEPYLAATPWSIEQGQEVLVHGDLSHLNFLVTEVDGVWKITGLIDWGDVKIGPASHEFISPGVHMYRGDRAALWQWYQGYALAHERATEYQHVVMARSMLYYAEGFANSIQRVPGAASCTDWSSMASLFWQMDSR